jgi:hypothetical protein
MEDISKIIEELKILRNSNETIFLITFIVIVIIVISLWHFLKKRIEKIAEEITEKNLKTFQSKLDKDFVKFSIKHNQQIDAVHDCYQHFQKLQSLIKFIIHGDKFTEPMKPDEEIKYLISFRSNVIGCYSSHKLLFNKDLRNKIESFHENIDIFIEEYIKGLMPSNCEIDIDGQDGVKIAGIWNVEKFGSVIEDMEEISEGVEEEFRKLYGTDE